MAEFLRAPLLRSEAAPEVTDFGPANRAQEIAYSGFSQAFRALAEQAFPVAAEERKREGAAAAQADVESGDFRVRRSAFTVRDREYNRAGLEMSAGRIETAAIEKTLELSRTHRADPAGFMANLRAYAAGVRSEVMPLNPELAERLHNRIIERAAPYIERLGANASADLRDASEAAMIELDARTTALMDDHARNLFHKDPAVAKAAGDALDKMVAEWATQFDAVDPVTGKPVFGQKERAEALLQIRRRAVEIGATQFLTETDNLGEAIIALTNGDLKLSVDGVEVDVAGYLDPTSYARVLRHGESLLKARNVAETAAEAKAVKAMEAASEVRRFGYVDKFVREGPTPEDLKAIAEDVAAGRLTGSDGEALQEMARSYMSEDTTTDRGLYDTIIGMVYAPGADYRTTTDFIIANAGSLSKSDLSGLLSRAKATLDSAGSEADPKRYYEKLLRDGLQTTGPFEKLDTNAQARIVQAMDEYYRRVHAGGEDPREAYLNLLERGRSTDTIPAPGDTSALLRPRHSVWGAAGGLDIAATLERTMVKSRTEGWSADRLNAELDLIDKWATAMGVELSK